MKKATRKRNACRKRTTGSPAGNSKQGESLEITTTASKSEQSEAQSDTQEGYDQKPRTLCRRSVTDDRHISACASLPVSSIRVSRSIDFVSAVAAVAFIITASVSLFIPWSSATLSFSKAFRR
jgi:hypothetical protein